MKIKVELDDEIVDEFVRKNILQSIKACYKNIVKLNEKDDLRPYEYEDLAADTETLVALKKVFKYYNVSSEYYKLDKYTI